MAALLIVAIAYTLFSSVTLSAPIGEYRAFYLFEHTSSITPLFSNKHLTHYFFLPGQKLALRMKIRSDVKEMAESLGERYPDIIEDIYMSNDLRVHLTIYKGESHFDINAELDKIRFYIQLYHGLYNDYKGDFFDIRKSINTKE